MIRALHVIDTLGRGGAEQLLVTLLPALREQGVEPVVAVLKPPYDLQADLRSKRYPSHPSALLLEMEHIGGAQCPPFIMR